MEEKTMEVTAAAADVATAATNGGMTIEAAQQMTSSTIYMMGFSFILGSCVTVLLLMLLDYMRMRREEKAAK